MDDFMNGKMTYASMMNENMNYGSMMNGNMNYGSMMNENMNYGSMMNGNMNYGSMMNENMNYGSMMNSNMTDNDMTSRPQINKCINCRCRGFYYVIKQGDTLYKISRAYGVSVSDIMIANPYINVYNLQIDDEICIPKALEIPTNK
ncbi:MAG: LysM peptidoglycan-binding domain-containing protein [Lachnotalea sp.]